MSMMCLLYVTHCSFFVSNVTTWHDINLLFFSIEYQLNSLLINPLYISSYFPMLDLVSLNQLIYKKLGRAVITKVES